MWRFKINGRLTHPTAFNTQTEAMREALAICDEEKTDPMQAVFVMRNRPAVIEDFLPFEDVIGIMRERMQERTGSADALDSTPAEERIMPGIHQALRDWAESDGIDSLGEITEAFFTYTVADLPSKIITVQTQERTS